MSKAEKRRAVDDLTFQEPERVTVSQTHIAIASRQLLENLADERAGFPGASMPP